VYEVLQLHKGARALCRDMEGAEEDAVVLVMINPKSPISIERFFRLGIYLFIFC
jgi:hypothetical protein